MSRTSAAYHSAGESARNPLTPSRINVRLKPGVSVQAALLQKNILTGTSGNPNILRLLPAYIMNEGHVDQLSDALAQIPA